MTTTDQPGDDNQTASPIADELQACLERLGATMGLQATTLGTEISKPAPPQTARAILRLDLAEDPKWRRHHLDIDETHHPKFVALARWAEWFIKRASMNDRSKGHQLVICGSVGTGKSDVSRSVKRWFHSFSVDLWAERRWSHPPKLRLIEWSEVVENEHDSQFENAIYDIEEADIVILEDVGSESDRFKSGQNVSRLRRALSKCENKWLLVNTNFAKDKWPEKFDVRVADRLEAAHCLDMTGVPSYRSKLRGGPA